MKIRPWEYDKYLPDNDPGSLQVEKIKKQQRGNFDGEHDKDNFEKYNPFVVRLDSELNDDIKNYKQIAFAVNLENFNIILSKSGHSTIMRKFGYDKRDFEGGWIFPGERKITFYSGTLGEVSKKQRQLIADAISNKLEINLRMVD